MNPFTWTVQELIRSTGPKSFAIKNGSHLQQEKSIELKLRARELFQKGLGYKEVARELKIHEQTARKYEKDLRMKNLVK